MTGIPSDVLPGNVGFITDVAKVKPPSGADIAGNANVGAERNMSATEEAAENNQSKLAPLMDDDVGSVTIEDAGTKSRGSSIVDVGATAGTVHEEVELVAE